MGDDDKGLPVLVAQLEEEVMELFRMVGVEVARGLVGKHHSGVVDKCPCHSKALLFATGELRWLVMGAFRDFEELQELHGLLGRLLHGVAGYERRQADVLQGGEFGQQVVELEDKTDIAVAESSQSLLVQVGDINGASLARCLGVGIQYPSAVGAVQGAKQLQQGGLAGSGGSDNADYFASPNGQVDVAQDAERAIGLVDIFYCNHGLCVFMDGSAVGAAVPAAGVTIPCR